MTDLARVQEAFSSKKWQWLFYTAGECPASLLPFLASALPHIDPQSWPQRLSFGGVYLNGLEVREDVPLKAPCKVEYYEPRFDLSNIHEFFPPFSEKQIVFEDDYLMVVYKPARLSSLPTKEQKDYNLKAYLLKYLGGSLHMPSRLDMSTQGLVCVSKNPLTHARLQRIFENRQIRKQYLLRSSGEPEWKEFTLEAPVGRDPSHAVLRRVVDQGGKPSTTVFSRLYHDVSSDSLYLLANPVTGRTHQIRVHAAHMGFPVRGDNFYGGRPADKLNLLSYSLALKHPVTGAAMKITVPEDLLPEWIEEPARSALSLL